MYDISTYTILYMYSIYNIYYIIILSYIVSISRQTVCLHYFTQTYKDVKYKNIPIFFIYNFVDTDIFRIFARHSTQAARLPKAVYKTRQGGTRFVDMSGR